ncbi:hypothetical protein [Mycobacterium kansasii]|uniref:hypothetical protein n=1 Tax=Mycobacterium kansasii TaxID=1768 RepID=UPI001E29C7B2|nr:hypothetical protein [Mycobacterium kansasii]
MRGDLRVALWVDSTVHAAECRRFDSYVVKGPHAEDCDFFIGAIGKDGYGRFFIYRGGAGICVRPNRYALARSLGVPLQADQLALHECDHVLCVKVCGDGQQPQHVVAGTQADNMRRMARMRRGGGRRTISADGLRARRAQSVALRTVLRERGWDRDAVQAALIGDAPTLW